MFLNCVHARVIFKVSARLGASFCVSFVVKVIALVALFASTAIAEQTRPAHHTDDGFKNPYLDTTKPSSWAFAKAWLSGEMNFPEAPENYRASWQKADKALLHAPTHRAQATLLGHSTVLLQAGGMNVLTDPMFSQRASPVSFAGPICRP